VGNVEKKYLYAGIAIAVLSIALAASYLMLTNSV